ncbi:MAG: hypothetical protein H6623_09020 [Bdellovibrionaceae bacterium]|nr:hypothetical protein [Pseudobdellovibrionaceae bacterium]
MNKKFRNSLPIFALLTTIYTFTSQSFGNQKCVEIFTYYHQQPTTLTRLILRDFLNRSQKKAPLELSEAQKADFFAFKLATGTGYY